jgi:hypothetical protein
MKKTIKIDNSYLFGCGKTSISLSYSKDIPLLCLSKIDMPFDTPVGKSLIDLDIEIKDNTALAFVNIESIDNLIRVLRLIKKDSYYKLKK